MKELDKTCNEGICMPRHEKECSYENKSTNDQIEDNSSKSMTADENANDKQEPKAKTKPIQIKETRLQIVSSIAKLHSQHDLDSFLSSNNVVIVKFITLWCGACKTIEEYYEDLSLSHQEYISCAKVVCDKNKQTKKLAALFKIKSYPVFIVFKDGAMTNRFDGADRGKLEVTFERLSEESSRRRKKRTGHRKRR